MIPKGLKKIKLEEDEKVDLNVFTEIDEVEEPKQESLDFYKNMENWLHLEPNVL